MNDRGVFALFTNLTSATRAASSLRSQRPDNASRAHNGYHSFISRRQAVTTAPPTSVYGRVPTANTSDGEHCTYSKYLDRHLFGSSCLTIERKLPSRMPPRVGRAYPRSCTKREVPVWNWDCFQGIYQDLFLYETRDRWRFISFRILNEKFRLCYIWNDYFYFQKRVG